MNNDITSYENGIDFEVEYTDEELKESMTAFEYAQRSNPWTKVEITTLPCAPSEAENKAVQDLERLVALASSDGHYNFDEYLYGMANGMILALAVLKDEEPQYLDRPSEWLWQTNEYVGESASDQYGSQPSCDEVSIDDLVETINKDPSAYTTSDAEELSKCQEHFVSADDYKRAMKGL